MTSERPPLSTWRGVCSSTVFPGSSDASHRHVTEALVANEPQRVHKMLQQLEELVSSTHSHIRSGGLIGLTGVA